MSGPAEGSEQPGAVGTARTLSLADFSRLLGSLQRRGHRLVGPRLESGAITFDDIASSDDLPRGWRDEQAPGSTRLQRRDDEALFGFASTTQSFKRFFHAPREPLLQVRRAKEGFEATATLPESEPLALIGLRGCDLRGVEVLDRVMSGGPHPDAHYRARRQNVAIVAVNCTQVAATCFCTSMGTGPRAAGAFDLSLTELVEPGSHRFLARSGSELGEELLDELGAPQADDADVELEERRLEASRRAIERHVDPKVARDLANQPDHPAWQEVADRCLSCANCTMACPTCFCSTVVDETSIGSEDAARVRRWDSCFTAAHGYVHGGTVHASVRSRHRQWVTHKFSTWFDQFGSSGCVGCGRCISACPVGIDITETVAAFASPPDGAATPKGRPPS